VQRRGREGGGERKRRGKERREGGKMTEGGWGPCKVRSQGPAR